VKSRNRLRQLRALVLPGVLLISWTPTAGAQASPPSGPGASDEAVPERPGLFRIGTWYLTPYIHVGTVGVDTNVFYTNTERQADFIASGGPGLEIVRPLGTGSELRLDGGLTYLYFARTDSQRKLTGYGTALLNLEGVKTRFAIEERYVQTFSRPNFQVNDRILQQTEQTRGFLRRNLGDRFRVAFSGERRRVRTDDLDYLGTNVGETLTEDRYRAGGELRRALSVKTSLVAGGEQTWHRFPRLPERNGDSTLAYGGLRTDETALISGQALGGYRWFRLDAGGGPDRRLVYADVDVTWNISPKTKLGGLCHRDLDYTAFATFAGLPTLRSELAEAFFDKVLVSNVYLRLFGRWNRLATDGEITLVLPGEGVVTEVRNDRTREAGAELGYEFRKRLRIGVTAIYTNRISSIETFGIRGLLAGLTVQYNPPQPVFR
jgi:hypothetical protein